MSTTETSQNSPPDERDAHEAAEAPPATEPTASGGGDAPAAAVAESSTNGGTSAEAPGEGSHAPEGVADASESDAAHAEGADGEGDGDAADAAPGEEGSGAATAEGHTEKKRRRRRRKKKPGAQAGAEGAAPSESPDAPAEGGAEAKPAENKGDKRDKKKERKHGGPPRERPPVNIGDIVFGKILEITDDAILIDIPGKAHAIFDRREMLLPDDDDERRPTPKPHGEAPSEAAAPADGTSPASPEPGNEEEGTPPAETAASGEAPAEEAVAAPVATESATEDAAAAEAPPEGGSIGAETLPATPVAVAASGTAVEAEGETAAAAEAPVEAPVEAPPRDETHKEPKVPRVILEVGADFIGVVHNDGARGGLVVLTHHPKRADRARAHVEKVFNDKTTTPGLVTGVIKGGVEVDVDGLRAFAPGSHVDLRLGADLSHLVGKRLPFFVTQYAKRGRDVVLSRKAMIEEDARRTRAEALAKLKVGEDMDGIVRSVVPFGAFVDVGGVEGLVPLQEMSHNRSDGPSDVFKAGEPTRVRVIKIDDKGKVWLSRKATIPDPWQEVARKYAQGTRHPGKVVRLQPFGAFVELVPGIDGLIHTSDLSIKRIETPEEVVKVGDGIEVVVSHVDANNHKIALHPAPQGAAADEAPQRVAPHKPVKAKVVNIESGGLVVRILGVTGRNARGYIPAGGTGTPRGTELRKAFNIGQEVEAKVIEMDPRRGEVKLSIKALSEEQERSAYQQYRQQLKESAKFTFADLLAKKKN